MVSIADNNDNRSSVHTYGAKVRMVLFILIIAGSITALYMTREIDCKVKETEQYVFSGEIISDNNGIVCVEENRPFSSIKCKGKEIK